MMIWTKNQHSFLLFPLLLFVGATFSGAVIAAPDSKTPFQCLRALLPITEKFASPVKRIGKFLVVPELVRGKVVGFYVYLDDGAWHYDTAGELAIADLGVASGAQDVALDLVAQPMGLETLSIPLGPSESRERRKIMQLGTRVAKSDGDLRAPLVREVSARREWIRTHNIPEESFRQLSRVMDGVCR